MIDFFPFYFKSFQLNYKCKPKYSNNFDIIISIISIISFILTLIYYINESFSKEPYLYYQNEKIENMANYTFSRLPFFIGLVDIQKKQFITNFGELIAPYLIYNNKSVYTELRIRACNETENLEIQELLTGKKNENKSEYNFLNDYSTINHSNKSNQTNAPYLFICPDLDGKEYILKGTQNVLRNDGYIFSFHFLKRRNLPFEIDYERYQLFVVWPDYYFNSLDYNNPIKKIGKSELFLLKNQTMEHFSMNYQQNKFISNKGFFIQKKNEINYLSYDSIDHKSYTQRLFDQEKEFISLVTLDIYLTNKIHIDYIQYIKFTDVLTKVVSLFSFIIQIFSKMSTLIRNKTIYIDLINNFQDNEIINKKIFHDKNNNELILDVKFLNNKKNKYKLSLCQYILPTIFFKNNSRIKLYKLYKDFFVKAISIETLINASLQINDFNYSNHEKLNNIVNNSVFQNEDYEKKQYLIDYGDTN